MAYDGYNEENDDADYYDGGEVMLYDYDDGDDGEEDDEDDEWMGGRMNGWQWW